MTSATGRPGQQQLLTVDSRPGTAPPITVLVRDESIELHPGSGHQFVLERGL